MMGAPVTIQVDLYDTPRLDVDILLAKMKNAFDKSPDIQEELRRAIHIGDSPCASLAGLHQ
jgi:hypothetical protein